LATSVLAETGRQTGPAGGHHVRLPFGTPAFQIIAGVLVLAAIAAIWLVPRYAAAPALGAAALAEWQAHSAAAMLPAWGIAAAAGDVVRPLSLVAVWLPGPFLFLAAAVLWIVIDARLTLAAAGLMAIFGVLAVPIAVGLRVWVPAALGLALLWLDRHSTPAAGEPPDFRHRRLAPDRRRCQVVLGLPEASEVEGILSDGASGACHLILAGSSASPGSVRRAPAAGPAVLQAASGRLRPRA
jgi:hypothetical protein